MLRNRKAFFLLLMLFSIPLIWPAPAISHGNKDHQSESDQVVTPTPELVAQGKKLFRRHCAICHFSDRVESRRGPGLKGLYARELTPVTKHPVNDVNIRNHIVQGGKNMPAFDDLKPGELNAIISFLKTL